MKRLWVLAVVSLVAVLPAPAEAQFFFEDFDSYVAGSGIAGQGGWDSWASAPAADALVSNAQSFTTPNSLAVLGAADIVHTFAGVTTGHWYAKVRTYVPSTQTGELFFILMNLYDGTCAAAGDCNWSMQVVMCRSGCTTTGVDPGLVVNLGGSDNPGSGTTTPVVLDQWVEILTDIDLDANTYTVSYNGVVIDTLPWNVSGVNAIAAVDLFSNGSSQSYMDNFYLDNTTIPVELQSFDVK